MRARARLGPRDATARARTCVAAEDVSVELRGAGSATRQVTNFLTPDAFGGADKLICCELLTPDGNWSSYPPHKHDATEGSPVDNEEIYYFRVGRAGTSTTRPKGTHSTAPTPHDGSIDATVDRERRRRLPRARAATTAPARLLPATRSTTST